MLFKEPNEAASALDPVTNSPKPLARIATARKLDFDMAKILKISTTDMPNAGTDYPVPFCRRPRDGRQTRYVRRRDGAGYRLFQPAA
jgi:hypothetical protein